MKILTFAILAFAAAVVASGDVDAISFSQLQRSAVSSVPSPSTPSSKVKKYLKPTSLFHNYDSADAFVACSIEMGDRDIPSGEAFESHMVRFIF